MLRAGAYPKDEPALCIRAPSGGRHPRLHCVCRECIALLPRLLVLLHRVCGLHLPTHGNALDPHTHHIVNAIAHLDAAHIKSISVARRGLRFQRKPEIPP